MNRACLILGSNKGDTLKNLNEAKTLIETYAGNIALTSSVYQTSAWGNTDQPDFLNQAVCINTVLSPEKLLEVLLNIEQQLGRIRSEQKWEERTMDIDILFYNDEIIDQPNLKVPHPYMQERKFVLVPLSEILPQYIHPVLNKKINLLLEECEDVLNVEELKLK